MFDQSDYQNLHAAISLATVMFTADALPDAANQVSNVAKASRKEYELTDKDAEILTSYITMALQSQSVVPSRTFDASTIGTLGKLVTKLKEVTPKNIEDQ